VSAPVEALEAECDRLMLAKMPDGYRRMVEARRRLAGPRAETVAPPSSDADIEALLTGLMRMRRRWRASRWRRATPSRAS
jgi:hypothetical protein